MNWVKLSSILFWTGMVAYQVADAMEQRKSDLIVENMQEELAIAQQVQLLEPDKFAGTMNSIFVIRVNPEEKRESLLNAFGLFTK